MCEELEPAVREDEMMEDREAIARIINPWAWNQFDAAIRPFEKNRGAQGSEGTEQFWYSWTYGQRNHRAVEEVRNWFMLEKLEGQEPGAVFAFRESLTKADEILAHLSVRKNSPPNQSDKEAAAKALGYNDYEDATDYRNSGEQDRKVAAMVEAFARHRIEHSS